MPPSRQPGNGRSGRAVRARTDEALLADYKTPLFVNGNIHDIEWEGTDAILRVIDEYAKSTDPAVETLLQRNRLVFNVSRTRTAASRARARTGPATTSTATR